MSETLASVFWVTLVVAVISLMVRADKRRPPRHPQPPAPTTGRPNICARGPFRDGHDRSNPSTQPAQGQGTAPNRPARTQGARGAGIVPLTGSSAPLPLLLTLPSTQGVRLLPT